VPLVEELAVDLATLRVTRATAPAGGDLLFAGRAGSYWSRSEFNNWRNRVWKPTMESLATEERLKTARPYDCRGSFVSLHFARGRVRSKSRRGLGTRPQ
jgi:hypothetical protein